MFCSDSRILIVDDMATMRRLTVYQLGILGYRNVAQAADGQQALDIILKGINEDNPVGLVISDWNMPLMSGIELLEIVRKSRNTADLPFMLVTAEDERTQVVRVRPVVALPDKGTNRGRRGVEGGHFVLLD